MSERGLKKVQVSLSHDDNKIIVRVVGAAEPLMVMSAAQAQGIIDLLVKAVRAAEERVCLDCMGNGNYLGQESAFVQGCPTCKGTGIKCTKK